MVEERSLRGAEALSVVKSLRRSNLQHMNKQYYIYIMTNKTNRVLYTGVTNDLKGRVYEHKEKLVEGFTKKYNISKLVFYEVCEDIESTIMREKQIKGWLRRKKIALIESINPEWRDLSLE